MTSNSIHQTTAKLHQYTLNRNSHIPIYHQLFELLRDRIFAGEWKSGDLFPPEPELMQQYQVSRITVRQAVEKLVHENLVYRERGRGTTVTYPRIKTDVLRLIGFEEDMAQRGLSPASRILRTDIVDVSHVTAERLQISVGDMLALIIRLRLADGEPISLEEICLVDKYCPGILDGHDFATESLYEVLEKEYNIRIERAEQTITAMVANKYLSEHLNIHSNPALLQVERISYSQLNIPVEFRRVFYRADRYAFQQELRR